MYSLRVIQEGSETNRLIGQHYEVVWKKNDNDEFNKLLETQKPLLNPETIDSINSFLIDSSGEIIPIFGFNKSYIVSERGNTYDRL